jgi:RHS repeat-associated protein
VKKHGRTAGAVGALSLKGTPLAVAGVQPLVGGEGLTAERTAALSTPESVDQRTASATAYEGLSPSEALSLANNTFPAVASEAGAGLPSLPEGEVVSEFIGSNAAQVSEPDGGSGVVEASGEIAVQTSPGQWGGINMSLEEANGTFVPKRAGATARIPKNLSEGVSLPISGLSLTPLASSAGTVASASAGVSDGYAVFWGGSSVGTDVDEIAKLGGGGSFELDSVLRSQRSPEVLRFKLGMPEGAELEQPGGGTGPVFVREAGKTIASVLPPSAVDAQGTQVTGVAMSLSGDILTITVPHPADAYAYPISVDPYVTDELLAGSNTNWRETKDGSKFTISGLSGSGSVTIAGSGSYTLSEAGMIYYPVHPGSEARITTVSVEVSTTLEGHNAEASIQLENNTKKVEKEERFTSNISKSNIGVKGECWKTINPECPYQSEEGTPENVARYALRPTGTGEGASTTVLRASVNLEQENGPELSFDKVSPTVDGGLTNILYSGGWLGPRSGSAFEIHAKDPGLGISYFGISGGGWVEKFPIYEDGECQGVQCNPEFNKGFTYSAKMANGEDALEAIAYDAANKDYAQVWPQYIKVDGAAPHSIVLSGLGPGGQVGAGEYHLKAEATDGTEPALSSGMRSLKLLIDGHTIGISSAPCSPGPCTGHSSTWTIFGHSYATGRHIVTVEAEDNVGNTSSENFTMIVHPASPIALGPGSFNPQSGEYSMTATDVSMGGGLTVSRSYSSEHPTAGAGGPLGTQWGMSLGGQESLVKQPTGSMVLTDASGAQTIFAPNGTGGYISPAGDSNLTLSSAPCEVGQTEFTLKNTAAGTTTCFKVPAGGSGEIWSPHITQGQVATDTVTYSYETAEVPSGSKNMITRPTEALAPVPAGISCSPTLKAGCRALTFNYATSTTAKGEAPTEWGDVEGNLTRVYYTAWEPISKEMKKVEVAHYEYDKMGRLRTVWDPRVKPQPLKPYFGYDSEGHLTALTPPGQETWGIVYGTISGSGVPGAVLKVEQAPPSATVWSGEGLANTEAPKLTGARTTGVRMAVTEGKWSGSPVIYGYQWEDCNTGGGGCVPIAGATNANYIPTSKDAGDRLGVVVTATNGSGSVSVTVYEPASAPTYASSFGAYGTGNGQLREPEGGLATDASGNVWVSDTENNRLEEFNSKGEFVRTVGTRGEGAGQFKTTYGLAVDSKGNIWATDEGNNRVEEFSSEGVFIKMFGWGVSNGEAKLEVCTSSCRAGLQGAGNGEFSIPEGIAIDSKGDVFVADRGNHRVQEFNPELAWSRNLAQTTEKEGPFYLTLDPNNDVWVTYSWDNKIGEFDSEGKLLRTWGTAGSEPGELHTPYGIAVGPEGNLWISEYGNNRVQVFSQAGEYLYGFGSKGNGAGQFNDAPQGIAFYGSSVYMLDSGVEWENTGNSRVEKWTMSSIKEAEGELRPVQPGSTVEYNVPVSGSGAPHAMGAKEVEEGWAQKDLPAEATAVFPADEPEGWPASDYKRAIVYYRDSTERTVNVATPTGGISTSEYNTNNDVIRALGPDNRAIAIKETNPATIAKELDTQSEYNSEGTELLGSLGPRHAIKLANGEEVQARSHTVYEYDNGAPAEGGPYRLVTQTTQGAVIEGKGEQEVRTTITGYSGQNGLGWKLRKPTSTTTNPGGLNLTRTTVYEESTGNVIETTTPGSNKLPRTPPTYTSSFGAYGTGNGQLREPEGGLATDASGNVWVSDTENNRLEEFNSKGEFVRTVGTRGEGAGQFKTTYGLAVDSKGNIWATDEGNNRVEEFSSEGVFIKMFGWGVSNGEAKLEVCTSSCRAGLQGAGNGEFSIPEGIAIDSKGDVFVADRGNHRVQEFNPELVWVHNLVQGTEKEGPFYLTVDSSNNVWVTYSWDNKIGEFNSEGKLIRTWGTAGTEPGKLSIPYGIAVGPENDVWIAEYRNNRVQVFTQTGEYLYEFGSKGNGPGQFNDAPQGIAFNGSSVYVLDSGVEWENTGNSRVEKWTMPTASKTAVNNMQTIYYTTAANGKYPKCGEHPEWANMACQTQPAEQPTTSGLPGLAVTTYTYNMYGEPTQVKSEVTRSGGGTDTRTTTTTYDEAGRPETTETASTVGTALPKVTDKYNSSTGMLVEQSTSSESLKSEYNTLGQLTSYTDADGNQSIYEYEKEKDYRLKKANDGKGSQTYEYDETTGNVKELKDTEGTSTLTFMAAYDVEGNMTSETYPNAMSANYAHNAAGETTGVEYVKTAHCAKTCPEVWYSDVADPSIHGQWITQQSNQAAQTYTYDEAGRLTQVLDNVAGKGCITRMYAYEEEGNRLSLTTRAPGTGGACATEGGEAQTHTYDPANRLLDTGTEYDSFGDTTKLPAADAGGTALTSTYYEDNELASQTQGTQTIGDQLDPAGRTREIVSTGKTAATEIQHYASPESRTPVWTGELSGSYTRYITGIGGGLVAIRHNNEKAALQLSNLHGDIVATAHDEEAPTTLESAITEASEYGVPASEGPPKYTWLGSQKIPTTLPSGIMAMGARSYVPQLGRYLQTDPKPGGSENQYAYVYGDPVNTTDLSGEWTFEAAAWVVEANAGWGAREEQAQLAREQAAREEAERLAAEAAALAAAQAAMPAESPQPKWVEEYAMGGPSLEETLASEGVVAGGGIEREGIRSLINVIADAGGCPNTNDPCYPKGGKGGSPNEGGTGSGCRSGRSSHDKCVTGNEGGGSIKNVACGLAGAGASGAGPAAGVAAGWLCSELTPR